MPSDDGDDERFTVDDDEYARVHGVVGRRRTARDRPTSDASRTATPSRWRRALEHVCPPPADIWHDEPVERGASCWTSDAQPVDYLAGSCAEPSGRRADRVCAQRLSRRRRGAIPAAVEPIGSRQRSTRREQRRACSAARPAADVGPPITPRIGRQRPPRAHGCASERAATPRPFWFEPATAGIPATTPTMLHTAHGRHSRPGD